jgi:hypothetical protein
MAARGNRAPVILHSDRFLFLLACSRAFERCLLGIGFDPRAE